MRYLGAQTPTNRSQRQLHTYDQAVASQRILLAPKPFLKTIAFSALIMLLLILLAVCVITLGQTCTPTNSDTLGPYYLPNMPEIIDITAGTATGPDLLLVTGTTFWDNGTGCYATAGILVEIWQADIRGNYSFAPSTLFRGVTYRCICLTLAAMLKGVTLSSRLCPATTKAGLVTYTGAFKT